MKKSILTTISCFMISISVYSEEKKGKNSDNLNAIPLFKYDYLSLDSRTIHSPGAGLVLQTEDLMFVGLYTRHSFEKPVLYNYLNDYHTIDSLFDGKINRHQYLGIFKSESDMPVKGGLKTFQAGAVYGYEIIKGKELSFVLGLGLAVGDFGIDFSNGNPLPVIPIPLIRMKSGCQWFKSSFDFLTTPNLNFTIGPKSQIRITGDIRMEQFRDNRDILYEFALYYRFFPATHNMGDFAGVAIGIKNDNYGAFDLRNSFKSSLRSEEDTDESIEIHYNAVFARIDITLLKITAGYAFSGRELYREEIKRSTGNGYIVSVEGLYQF